MDIHNTTQGNATQYNTTQHTQRFQPASYRSDHWPALARLARCARACRRSRALRLAFLAINTPRHHSHHQRKTVTNGPWPLFCADCFGIMYPYYHTPKKQLRKKSMGGSVFVVMDTLSSGPRYFLKWRSLRSTYPPTMGPVSFGI